MAVVLITGASSGFGLQGAIAFAAAGFRVYAGVRSASGQASLTDAAAHAGVELTPVMLDMQQPELFRPLIQQIVNATGRIDVLVNNAGIHRAGVLEETSDAMLGEVMTVNCLAPIALTRCVLPFMRTQGSGCIIMVSSLSGIAGLPGECAYTASKFALEGASEGLRHEVDRFGIRVALVEAGRHATAILEPARAQRPDPASPYAALLSANHAAVQEGQTRALNPAAVGELFVRIAQSEDNRLRWCADVTAERVVERLLGDDSQRDTFLQDASGLSWWSEGADAPVG